MLNLHYALFQMMRYDNCLQSEARMTKTLKHRARMRERDESLRFYLNATSPSGHLYDADFCDINRNAE